MTDAAAESLLTGMTGGTLAVAGALLRADRATSLLDAFMTAGAGVLFAATRVAAFTRSALITTTISIG